LQGKVVVNWKEEKVEKEEGEGRRRRKMSYRWRRRRRGRGASLFSFAYFNLDAKTTPRVLNTVRILYG
jgi:hypothetical protein